MYRPRSQSAYVEGNGRMPTDPITGLPYAILPVESDYLGDDSIVVNYHHHFYNRRDPELEGEYRLLPEDFDNLDAIPLEILAGFALRISRGQRLPGGTHQLGHRRYPRGPVLPTTVNEKFIIAAKACSGIVSRWALDVTAPKSERFVYMDDDVFAEVASPKLLCTERVYYDKPADHRRKVLGGFFLRHAAMQDLSHISERIVDEFLHTQDDNRRRAVGNVILREAVEVSLAPVIPIYRELKAKGMVQPGRPEPRAMVWKYVHPHRREAALSGLAQRLAA